MTLPDGAFASGSELPGGYINAVVRIGDTVRRPAGPNSGFVRELLRFLEKRGFPAAPRFLGIDDEGREVLSYVEGHVAWAGQQPPGVWSDESLVAVARMVRRLHDVTAGTDLAGAHEAVLHGDLAPRNAVYVDHGEGYRPVAFIDWDNARPGRRLDDIADMLWHYLCPCPQHAGPLLLQRMRDMCDAYGLEAPERRDLAEVMLQRMRGVMYGIASRAAHGSIPHLRLMRMGALRDIGYQAEWVERHLVEIQAALA